MSAYYRLTPIGEEKPDVGYVTEFNTDKGKLYYFPFENKWSCREDKLSEEYPSVWYKPVNPVEALIEKYEKELEVQEGNIKKFLATSLYEIKKRIIEKFINDLKSI